MHNVLGESHSVGKSAPSASGSENDKRPRNQGFKKSAEIGHGSSAPPLIAPKHSKTSVLGAFVPLKKGGPNSANFWNPQLPGLLSFPERVFLLSLVSSLETLNRQSDNITQTCALLSDCIGLARPYCKGPLEMMAMDIEQAVAPRRRKPPQVRESVAHEKTPHRHWCGITSVHAMNYHVSPVSNLSTLASLIQFRCPNR